MSNAILSQMPPSTESVAAASVHDSIEYACSLIPPLWTLRNFVAVNPFLGYIDKPFLEGTAEIERIHSGRALLSIDAYLECYEWGRIGAPDLDAVLAQAPAVLRRPELAKLPADSIRKALFTPDQTDDAMRTYSEWVDRVETSAGDDPTTPRWSRTIVQEISKWCSGRFDVGQSSWPQPYGDLPLYVAWRRLAQLDRAPEIRGFSGFRKFVRALPESPEDCIAQVLRDLDVPEHEWGAFLAHSLASIAGWAGHLQYRIRQASMGGDAFEGRLVELLAIRLAFDGALHALKSKRSDLASWPIAQATALEKRSVLDRERARSKEGILSEFEARHLWQLAYEAGFRRELLLETASQGQSGREASAKPFVQAAFCIDVRSEIFRRRLEAASDRIQTIGFAGFFGLPIEAVRAGESNHEPRCPALLAPSIRIAPREDADAARLEERKRRGYFHSFFKQLRLSSVSAFPFVETVGQSFGLRLITDSFGWTRPGPDSRLFKEPRTGNFDPSLEQSVSDEHAVGMDLDSRVAAAVSILTNMGMTREFAPYVLFCGHGSTTTNNPYGSALDCGACGGYAGDVNARAAVAILNDPKVREGVLRSGIEVPRETRFVAGLHDTTTDRITLFDTAGIPAEDLCTLNDWLEAASAATRKERSARLGIGVDEPNPERKIEQRSRDWSELRPEWGLAGNAGFIAAPRERTKGVDLGGRCFLHDYHADRDPTGAVLELILSAPLVVASWINLQYYASTVDNETFGSGSKTIHNVVGRHGVLSGNGGDLRVGLPFQSVHDGERFVHEPMRLTALVEAPTDRINEILGRQKDLRNLVENQWIHLIAIDSEGAGTFEWTPDGFQRMGDDDSSSD